MSICLYSCLSCLACTVHLFCAALYCHLWLIWLSCVFHFISYTAQFFKKVIEHNACFHLLYNFCLKHFSL